MAKTQILKAAVDIDTPVNIIGASMASLTMPTVNMTKKESHNVKLTEDITDCWIVGISILKDGVRILVDNANKKLKMFCQNMELQHTLQLKYEPWGTCVFNDSEIVISVANKTLLKIGISCIQMNVKQSHELSFKVSAIAKCFDNNFVVTCPDPELSSVKLIDLDCHVYWSLSCDWQGQQLFACPWYLCQLTDHSVSIIVVSDYINKSLTVVNTENGDILTSRKFAPKDVLGITGNNNGYIYACYSETREVALLSSDLSEERIVLSPDNGIDGYIYPQAIAFDNTANQLLVSYDFEQNTVDCFQLTKTALSELAWANKDD